MLAIDRDLSRVFDIDDATKVKLAGDRVTDIGKGLTAYDAVSAGLFVMSPSLIDALASLSEPSLTEGVAAAAARGLVVAHDVGTKLWQDVDSPEMKLHADWLLRVYGDELAQPRDAGRAAVAGGRDAGADRAPAGREGPARLRAVQPRARS